MHWQSVRESMGDRDFSNEYNNARKSAQKIRFDSIVIRTYNNDTYNNDMKQEGLCVHKGTREQPKPGSSMPKERRKSRNDT
jgi:hypothetical protein